MRLIDADDLKWSMTLNENGTQLFFVSAENIHNAPTIDAVERPKGRWEIIVDDYDCEMMRCSACKVEFYDGDNDTVDHTYNFCPHCGADMRGESE